MVMEQLAAETDPKTLLELSLASRALNALAAPVLAEVKKRTVWLVLREDHDEWSSQFT